MLIADLQVHSKHSRAVSQKMDLGEIASWAAKKGIGLVATGDWTHPAWFAEIKERLEETEPGIFRLKGGPEPVRFLLSTEISSIYTQGGKGRRVHNLVFSPSIAACERLIALLEARGAKLGSDGRPIVGISSRDILAIALEADPAMLFVPAHVWTPWFGLFGAKSGFDSIAEAFGDLAGEVRAVETGLSSDPAMNWRIAELDNRAVVSFSDAHSGPKLGREATVFSLRAGQSFAYADVSQALSQEPGGQLELAYTIEFFPEEGKYHWAGHRACGVCRSPEEVARLGLVCPVCGKRLTEGVAQRVEELAARPEPALAHRKDERGITFVGDAEGKRLPFVSLVPLLEILTETIGSPTKAGREYERLTELHAEFDWLLNLPLATIEQEGGEGLARAIGQVRERDVKIDSGYDGVFGKLHIDG